MTDWQDGHQNVEIVLPSGRTLVYRGLERGRVAKPWGYVDEISYLNGRGVREGTYGGKLAENVVQAVCRDIMAYHMVELSRAGYEIVFHVHDEIVCEGDSAAELPEMLRIMSAPPPWAAGFPLDVEGYTSERYGAPGG